MPDLPRHTDLDYVADEGPTEAWAVTSSRLDDQPVASLPGRRRVGPRLLTCGHCPSQVSLNNRGVSPWSAPGRYGNPHVAVDRCVVRKYCATPMRQCSHADHGCARAG